ncbi:MAG: ATP synthase F1 subunit delta [Dehalococcoidales bacterium]
MPKKANARRYAQAVFEIARETRALERWRADLQKLADAMGNVDFLAAMESPKIKFDDKSRLLARLGDINPLALNLARLLIAKNGIGMMNEVSAEYQRLVDAYHGIQKAKVVTAVPIDDKDKEKLAEDLGAMVGSKIVIESEVDPGILGGIIARIGGKLLDGSTRSKLVALKRELAGGAGKV